MSTATVLATPAVAPGGAPYGEGAAGWEDPNPPGPPSPKEAASAATVLEPLSAA
jgi:hypothetical protein